MDIERKSYGSRFSNQIRNSDRQSRHSVMSLERSSENRSSNMSNRISLINAMDLQIPNNSGYDVNDDFFGGRAKNRFSDLKRLSDKQQDQYSYAVDIEEKDLNRNSNYKLKHECNCTQEECQQRHCICYLTPRQICIIGQCCPNCIAIKNQYLKQTRGFQAHKKSNDYTDNNHILQIIKQKNTKNMHYFKHIHSDNPSIKDLIFCTCKKSHCQKKYCLCYQKGVICGQYCNCIECFNKEDEQDQFREQEQRRWERYAIYKPYDQSQDINDPIIDPDIQQFIDNPNNNVKFNEKMQFQPVNFDHFFNNNFQQ